VTELVDRVKLRERRLLDAAARLFARFGFDKTSVDEIASAAGVSKGAVYLHWPSKFSLFEAVLLREGLACLDEILERVDADPQGGTLGSIYRHSIQALGANPLLLAAYTVDTAVLGDYVRHQEPRILGQRALFGEEFVRRMQAANLIRPELQPEMTAYVMGVISFGLLSIGQLAPALRVPPLEALADVLADVVERGLGTGDRHAADAGKQAFRILIDDTRALYSDRTAPSNG
jgi:TetR/AcrR family acrAB operon transcriptional repressor